MADKTKNSPIMVVEDSRSDAALLAHVLEELGVPNEMLVFSHGADALRFLLEDTRPPFIILCDIHLPKMNGLELKQSIDNISMLKRKSIPFIFLTTSINPREVKKAYELNIQGYFEKNLDLDDFKAAIKAILDYWSRCELPQHFSEES